MSKTRVGILRGGPSSEYEVSLKTGTNVARHLPEKYQAIDILIDKDGVGHIEGLALEPSKIFDRVDVIFNAMHGEYGEDGKIQQLLDHHQKPYTGSRALSSALAMNKEKAKNIFKQHGLKTPVYKILRIQPDDNLDTLALELFRSFPVPLIIKPVGAGSSIGVHLVRDFQTLVSALKKVTEKFQDILIEEYIAGREATVGVIDHFRNHPVYSLPPIEIKTPSGSSFFDFRPKYSGESEEVCPGNFSSTEKAELEELAKRAHQALGLRHYSRSDFIVHPRRGIFILETNTLPGLTNESLFPKGLRAVGSNLSEFLGHVVSLAQNK